MPRRIASRSELARLAGVSPAAVTKLCRPGKKLAPACVGDRVDLDHEATRAWLASKGRDGSAPPTAPSPKARKAPPAKARARTKSAKPSQKRGAKPTAVRRKKQSELLPDLAAYMSLTLREILARHGTVRELKDLLEARAKIAAIQERELDMSRTRQQLVERELVRLHVVGAFQAAFRRLLTDAGKTLVRRLFAAGKAGETVEAGEKLARDIMGSHLRVALEQAAKALQDA